MMKKLVGNVMSVLLEVLMWLTFAGCALGGMYLGYSEAKLGVAGAVGGLVLGAIAGLLLNCGWWLISAIQEIRDYSKKWLGKYKTEPEPPPRMPDFWRMLAGNGRKAIISLASVALLAGIAVIAKNFTDSDAGERKAAGKEAEKAEEPAESLGFKTVKMPDGRIWMAENLSVEKGNSACYNNEPGNCQKCGRLYDWAAASIACPAGWHLPSDAEWASLGNAASMTELQSKNGFAALPCGRHYDGKFLHYGALAFFWSSTESDANYAWGSALDANNANLDRANLHKSYMRSVRCVRD